MHNLRTRMALLAIAGLAASAATAVPVVRAPAPPKAEPYWDGSNRKRAQWKNETNKRGRNR